jgi:hypothetical protein
MQNQIGDRGIGLDMKRFHFIFLLILLLAACQSAPATSVPTPSTQAAATPQRTQLIKSISTPSITPNLNGPAVHSSNTDLNASDLIVVKDQYMINNSLTLDLVTSSQAAFVVLYYDKQAEGRDVLGKLIAFIPISAGKSNHFIFSLTQNLNPTVNIATLPNNLVEAVLQTNSSNPNSIVKVNGKDVSVPFMILSSAQGHPSIFSTATP